MPTSAQISSEMKWEHVDWLVMNEGEVQQLLDAFSTSSSASQTEMQHSINVPDSCLRSSALILRLASQPLFENVNIVCTLGPLGVLAHLPSITKDGESNIIHEPGVPTTELRDTTGAGDCWTGYLVAGLMELEVKTASVSNNLDKTVACHLLRRCNQVRRYLINNFSWSSLPCSLDTYSLIIPIVSQAAGMCVEKDGAMESFPENEEVAAMLLESS
jgi:ribokinase